MWHINNFLLPIYNKKIVTFQIFSNFNFIVFYLLIKFWNFFILFLFQKIYILFLIVNIWDQTVLVAFYLNSPYFMWIGKWNRALWKNKFKIKKRRQIKYKIRNQNLKKWKSKWKLWGFLDFWWLYVNKI